jgi:hypothetical protein
MRTRLLLFCLLLKLSSFSQEVGLVANFPFNNSATSVVNSDSFIGNIAYTSDRNNVANQAFSRTLGLSDAIITSLPVGNSERTISLWFKLPSNSGERVFFECGSGTTNSRLFLAANSSIAPGPRGFSFGAPPFNNFINYTILPDVWYHYAMTIKTNGEMNIYVNGVLNTTYNGTINTASGNQIYMDGGYNGAVDDLKIYNRALTNIEVYNLYAHNSSIAPAIAPIIFNVSEIVSGTSAIINYQLSSSSLTTTSIIRYGLTPTSLTSQVTGFSSNSSVTENGSATITGLQPGTTYYYKVEATNNVGTTIGNLDNFTTLGNSLLHEFKFNNSTYNEGNTIYFGAASVPTNFYTTDRFGNPNAALSKAYSAIYQTVIPNLPVQDQARTISVWIKPAVVNSDNIIFSYGLGSGDSAYGASFNANNLYSFTYASNLAFAHSVFQEAWKHVVIVYDEAKNAKIYVNGVLGSQGNYPLWYTHATGTTFYLGNLFGSTAGSFNGAIDDLKIFNVAISDAEVLNLYNNNTLSSSDFTQNNLEVALYPNPVRDILNIETTLEVQSVEIYNIQGQKVLSSNQKQINVSDLAAGMYMVRIQDAENNIATKKIVIK